VWERVYGGVSEQLGVSWVCLASINLGERGTVFCDVDENAELPFLRHIHAHRHLCKNAWTTQYDTRAVCDGFSHAKRIGARRRQLS
jgi:hypothetical protein